MVHGRQRVLVSRDVPGAPGTVDQPPAAVYVDHRPRVAERLAVHPHAWLVAGAFAAAQDYLTVEACVAGGRNMDYFLKHFAAWQLS